MQQPFALALEAGFTVWHCAFALRVANLAAKVRFAGIAEFAISAFGGAKSLQGQLRSPYTCSEKLEVDETQKRKAWDTY